MLDGLRVLDLGPGIAPSFCAKMLADYGAEVIKVEPPGEGDPARRMGPFVGDDPDIEKSIPFLYLNTGKRGVTLDYSRRYRPLRPPSAVWTRPMCWWRDFRHLKLKGHGIGYSELSRSHPWLGGNFSYSLRTGRSVPGLPGDRHHNLRHERLDVPLRRL